MNIELIVVSWLLGRLKNENLIDDATSNGVKKRFLQTISENLANSELKDIAA